MLNCVCVCVCVCVTVFNIKQVGDGCDLWGWISWGESLWYVSQSCTQTTEDIRQAGRDSNWLFPEHSETLILTVSTYTSITTSSRTVRHDKLASDRKWQVSCRPNVDINGYFQRTIHTTLQTQCILRRWATCPTIPSKMDLTGYTPSNWWYIPLMLFIFCFKNFIGMHFGTTKGEVSIWPPIISVAIVISVSRITNVGWNM